MSPDPVSFETSRLDDEWELAANDPSGMLRALATAGAQVRRAVTTTEESGVLRVDPADRPRAVVVAAMGADDLIADVATMLATRHSPIAVWSAHDLPLPGWVGSLDLVLAVSLSGRAQGPLRLAAEAGRRGATVVGVGAADSPLAAVVESARGTYVAIDPAGLASRSAAWSLLTPTLMTLAAHGILPVGATDLEQVADRLDEVAAVARPSSESFVNPAKLLAQEWGTRIPLLLADGPLAGVAARRAATMLARTARVPVMSGELPDAASELISCLDGPYAAPQAPDGGRDIFADPVEDKGARPEVSLLLVRDAHPARDEPGGFRRAGGEVEPLAADAAALEPQDNARIGIAQGIVELADARGARVHELIPGHGSELVRLAELIAHVDFAATYLALGFGFDPAAAPTVRRLHGLTH